MIKIRGILMTMLGLERCYDGVTEQWFESIERFQSLSEPEQKTLVEPDVAYMLDPAGTHFIMRCPVSSFNNHNEGYCHATSPISPMHSAAPY